MMMGNCGMRNANCGFLILQSEISNRKVHFTSRLGFGSLASLDAQVSLEFLREPNVKTLPAFIFNKECLLDR
jgi:hypothetical protein